jgi:hypothetical protein
MEWRGFLKMVIPIFRLILMEKKMKIIPLSQSLTLWMLSVKRMQSFAEVWMASGRTSRQ